MNYQLRHFASVLLVCFLFLWIASPLAVGQPSGSDLEFFEKRIRPLLEERCLECHGEKKHKGGLRLDSAAAVRTGGDSGPALIPGQPGESRLLKAVEWLDPDLQMPPKNKLSDREIGFLREWIQHGAADSRTAQEAVAKPSAPSAARHWAYLAPVKVQQPAVKDVSWPRGEMDRFVLARLEARGLRPAPDADRATLLRRIYFDLTGLPPAPEEIEKWMGSAISVAEVVDRLLASPEFGERWGRHWLDVARYGESVTLRGLVFQEAWRYRDFVIDAFNRDMPYDQFLREQVAGDLMPGGSVEERQRRLAATTFLALGNWNLEEQDKAQLRMDIVDEQLDTLGKAFMAQTFGCARCHDHKFDPIPTRDYYAMAGILRNTRTITNANVSGWIERPLPQDEAREEKWRSMEARIVRLTDEVKSAREKAQQWVVKDGLSAGPVPEVAAPEQFPGVVVDSAQARTVGVWKLSQFSKHYIGDGYLHDDNGSKGEKTLTFTPDLRKPGRYEVRLAYVPASNRASNVPVTVFHADGETTVAVNQKEAPSIAQRFVSLGQFRFEGNGFGHVLVATEGTDGYVIADAVQFLPVDLVEAAALGTAISGQPMAENARGADRVKELETELKTLREKLASRPRVMTVQEEEEIGDTYIHIRGSVRNVGPKVPRGFLKIATLAPAPQVPAQQSGRIQLAEWITAPSNPLTARVMVNRVWHWLFGSGLVRTTDNFGTMGEAPSHPELLDHLAVRFVEQGWSLKKLVREMILSRAYQVAARSEEGKLEEADPDNRLFGRATRRRLDAECLRDGILSISGRLDPRRGGSVIPAGLTADYGYRDTNGLRSVYVPAFRNSLPELFEAFDFADPSTVTGVRTVSTVAPQALFLLNHPFMLEESSRAAARLLGEPGLDDQARGVRASLRVLGRRPTPGEDKVLRSVLEGAESRLEGWSAVFHLLMSSADFRYLN